MSEEQKSATPAAEKPAKIEKNGVTRPGAGTSTGRVWEIADELSAKAGSPAARKDVLAQCEKEGINVTTGATQYGRWCKFNGVVKPKAEPKPKKEKAPKATPAPAAAPTVE